MGKIALRGGAAATAVVLLLSAACAAKGPAAISSTNTSANGPSSSQQASPTPANGANSGGGNASTSAGQLTIPELVKLALPAVVKIETPTGVGSGFVVSSSGYVITNNHVISGSNGNIQITLNNGAQYKANVVGTDPGSDLALLKINATGLTALKMGTLANTQVGEEVVAIGYALDLGGAPTVTSGIVSAKDRAIQETSSILGAIQTDAAINHGNSGGPLLNMQGQVVGVNTAIAPNNENGGVSPGIGYAVGADTVSAVYQQLKANGRVNRGFLGIQGFEQLLPGLAQQVGLPQSLQGIYLPKNTGTNPATGQPLGPSVVPGSPAALGGLKPGDVITSLGGLTIHNESQLAVALITHHAGEKVTVQVYRDGKTVSLQVTLGTPPSLTG